MKESNFCQRLEMVCKNHNLQDHYSILKKDGLSKDHLNYLGGFVLGEGSVNASIKVQADTRFGFGISPQFSVTQHVSGIINLIDCMYYFNSGAIGHKQGSDATMVYAINDRAIILEKVILFYENYVFPFCGISKTQKVKDFQILVTLLLSKKHFSAQSMAFEILPLVFALRSTKSGKKNQKIKSLKEAHDSMEVKMRASLQKKGVIVKDNITFNNLCELYDNTFLKKS